MEPLQVGEVWYAARLIRTIAEAMPGAEIECQAMVGNLPYGRPRQFGSGNVQGLIMTARRMDVMAESEGK